MWGHMSTTDLPGSSLLANRYRLVERLGAGGMSVVWRGFDEVLGRQVAVKVLPPSTSTDPSFRRRLRAEAQAAARLSHPHITNVYDYGEATTADGEPVPYVVMELVDGESLAAVLARVRRLPWPAAVRICSEVSAALAAAHARGIVHRDVTPANVMLTPTGAKVVDFGISALIGENDIDPDGSLLGTPAYLAPERLEGGQVSPATDVYAVGLLIYRTLIGQLPWDVGTTTALLRAHQYTEPEPLPPVEGLPHEVSALVERCLEKRPDDRPSSAEMAHVLAGVATGNPAARGYVPEWAESGEDTTILPSSHPYTDGIARVRPGQARPADGQAGLHGGPSAQARLAGEGPGQGGRGVAAVRAAAEGPAGMGAAAAVLAAAAESAPVSPAPGAAMPVSVADVRDAVAGRPVGDGFSAVASVSPAAMSSPSPAAEAAAAGANRGPGQAAGRNNRFGAAPRPAPGPASDAPGSSPAASASPGSPGGSAAAPGADAAATALRPAVGGAAADGLPQQRSGGGGGGGTPPPGGKGPGGPGGGPSPRSGPRRGPRMLLLVGALVMIGGGAYGWTLVSAGGDTPGPATVQAMPTPSVLAASGKCVVSYAVRSDDGSRFQASVTVANRDNVAVKNWNLLFVMKGSQTVRGVGKVDLDQQGTMITVKSAQTLSAQKAVTLDIAGRYTGANPAPMAFMLGDQNCETYVSPKPGEPSRPVVRLPNGEVRLGDAVKKPQPGLSIGPGGVVVPIPGPVGTGPVTTTTPATGTTTTTSTAPGGGGVDVPVLDCAVTPLDPKCVEPSPDLPNSEVPTTATSTTTTAPPTETATPEDTTDVGPGTGGGGGPGGDPGPIGNPGGS